jgi:N-methylhydantoinase A
VALKGYDPREFVLFACGGAGPSHACGFAPYLGVNKVVCSPWSPVFGAFGASTMKIQQVWDKSRTLKIFQWQTQSYSEDITSFNAVVDELTDLALRDLRLEGYSEEQVELSLELDMRYGMQYNLTRVPAPFLRAAGAQDFQALCDRFTAQYSETYSPEATFPQGGVNVECFYLTASVRSRPPKVEPEELTGPQAPDRANREPRAAFWPALGGFKETPVFSFEELLPGNLIAGPALIEAADTTYVVDPGWRLSLDVYRNAVLERA